MVVANLISPERKERLARRGINFREIPAAKIESLVIATRENEVANESSLDATATVAPDQQLTPGTSTLHEEVFEKLREFQRDVRRGYGIETAAALYELLNNRLQTTKGALERLGGDRDTRYDVAFVEFHRQYKVSQESPLPLDKRLLAESIDCATAHADLLLYTHSSRLRNWWINASQLAREMELPDEFLKVLLWGSQSEARLAEIRTDAMAVLLA